MAFLPDNNLAYPVLISSPQSVGSGFYLRLHKTLWLVTAKHVLFDRGLELFSKTISLTSATPDLKKKTVLNVDCEVLFASGGLRKHLKSDVAVALVAVIDDEGEKGKNMSAKFLSGVTAGSVDRPHLVGLTQENTTSFDKVGISNDVILFGYPTSLGNKLQLDPALPLLRRGMVAGKTEDRRIVIDCPVYFGNSGGLVVEVDQHRPGAYTFNGIGIAVEMIPFVEELWSKQFRIQSGVRHENSGYTIVEPFDRITELVADLS